MMQLLANPIATYMTAIGTLLLLGALALLASRVRLVAGERAQGQIIGYSERMLERPGARKQYMPVVRFHPRGGAAVEFQSRMGSSSTGLQIGEPVLVIYRPDKPEVAEIASVPRLWIAPAALVGFAAVVLYGAWKAGASH